MAVEYRIRFDDPTWLGRQKEQVEQWIQEQPSFVEQHGGELWLKDSTSRGAWAFDVRVFVEAESILFEVSSKTRAFREDARRLYETIAAATRVHLEDGDDPGEPVDIDRLFR